MSDARRLVDQVWAYGDDLRDGSLEATADGASEAAR